MLPWQAGHKAFSGYLQAFFLEKTANTHEVFPSYHVHIRNRSKAGNKYVCFHLCDATCNKSDWACEKCDAAQDAFKLLNLKSNLPPDPGLSLLSYPSNSRSKMRVMLSELIFSFPLTLLELQRKEINSFQNTNFLSLFLMGDNSPQPADKNN